MMLPVSAAGCIRAPTHRKAGEEACLLRLPNASSVRFGDVITGRRRFSGDISFVRRTRCGSALIVPSKSCRCGLCHGRYSKYPQSFRISEAARSINMLFTAGSFVVIFRPARVGASGDYVTITLTFFRTLIKDGHPKCARVSAAMHSFSRLQLYQLCQLHDDDTLPLQMLRAAWPRVSAVNSFPPGRFPATRYCVSPLK